ncbi:terminase small subunit [Rhizobium phage RL2RES]|uniref:Terminase small subunit n=1 Tax=Rhizobium phage RL2RES TaxID=103371 RepID=A0A6B9J1V0_9CAUD|nr:terminase small subunit [Rhizobium phage RL2RES]QGZ14190.1 terminase small subunit [Rhizobium phage RL2RES]
MADKEKNGELTFDYSGSGDIMELLRSGTPEVGVDVETKEIVVYIAADDTEEVKIVKDNVEFVVNTARSAVALLLQLGKTTGNPRFFETMNSLLNTINGANGQLMNIDRKKKNAENPETPAPGTSVTHIQNNTVVMSTSDALKEARKNIAFENAKIIDVTEEAK